MSTRTVEDIYELSPLQQGLLFHSHSVDDPEMYVAQRSYQLHGKLDQEALAQAWRDVVARHPALRTSFHWDDLEQPLQVVRGDASVELNALDWRELSPAAQQERLGQYLADDRNRGFDLARAPLMRLALIRLDDDRHQFVWTHHMILLDGWSVPLVSKEIFLRYAELTRGERGPLRPAPPFSGYIDWLQGRDAEAAERFWREALTDAPTATALAGPGSSPVPGEPVETATRLLSLPVDTTEALQAVAARHRVTLNTLVQAAWALLLSRHTGSADVVFGVTTSGRPADLPGVESTVGLFINTLPLRLAVPADLGIGEWLREVQARQAGVREYEYSRLSQIRGWSGAPGGQPLFESIVVFENYPVAAEVRQWVGDLQITMDSSVETTSEPLTVLASAEPGLTIRLQYHRGRFEEGFVAALADQLRTVFEHLSAGGDGTVDDVPLISDGDYRDLARQWNDTSREYPRDETLHGMIGRQIRRSPDAVAVVAEDGQLTYAELDARSDRLAAVLRAHGAAPGGVVGVCGERSPALLVGLLAVLKSGAAYLALDPELPLQRLRLMLDDAGAELVLGDLPGQPSGRRVLSLAGPWPEPAGGGTAVAPEPPRSAPDDPAYVLYTSGSTGRPKGVQVSHAAICNRLAWMQETFALDPRDRVLHKTPFTFDVSVWELFWPLLSGARLVLARPGGHRDAAYLVRAIAEHRITVGHFVPSMLRHFLAELSLGELSPGAPSALRRVFCSGEALTADLTERFRECLPSVELHNLYGPTEAAVDVSWWDCREQAPVGLVPIGRPIANTRLHLLDRSLRPVPVGVPAELHIGGVQLADGYLNRAEQTAAAFVPDPYGAPGDRLYRTGDLARRLPDGAVEYLGRLDHQIKLRGIRIEPGEIESALTSHPAVREAVVLLRSDGPRGPRLVGYLVPAGAAPDLAELRARLATGLPAQLVPAEFVVLERLPLTANGKLDRAALPPAPVAAPVTGPGQGGAPVPPGRPRTDLETVVAEAFASVLDCDPDDEESFFDLGGDSFGAVRAVRAIPGASVTMLFQHPTVRGLAAALKDPVTVPQGPLLRLTPESAAGRRTLVCVPYGGGNAIAYRPLAAELPDDIVLQAVRLPGHDLGAAEPLQPLAAVADECARAILAGPAGPLALYGHCIGVALAVELARRLEDAGRTVDRVFLGGSYPFPARHPRLAALARLAPFRRVETDQQTLRYLQSLGGFEGLVDDEELASVMQAFRHDGRCAGAYFTERYAEPEPVRLRAPITFVAGDADPETPRFGRRYREWERFSSSLELAVVPGGGHYFPKHHAAELAGILRRTW